MLLTQVKPHPNTTSLQLTNTLWLTSFTDLTWANIVFALPDIQSMSRDAVYKLLGPTETKKLKLRDGSYSAHSPRRIVKSPAFSGFDIQMTNGAVMIIDFGEAFLSDRPCPRSDLGIPIFSLPPEICFGQPPSSKSDVWELACLLVEIFCGRPLFPLIFGGYELLISYIVDYVGILPASWKGHFRADVYGTWENGELSSSPDGVWWWFEEIPGAEKSDLGTVVGEMAMREGLAAKQHVFLTSLLRGMMAREPAERLSAPTVLLRLNAAAHLFEGEVAEKIKVESARNPGDPPSPSPPQGYDDSESE